MCGALALGMAGCSSSVKLPSLGGPAPDQPQEITCESLNAEKARLLAERDDLKSPLRSSSMTEAQRDAELTQLKRVRLLDRFPLEGEQKFAREVVLFGTAG